MTRPSPFMTIQETALYLRMTKPGSIKTLYRWARAGLIPARKHNGRVVFHQDDIDHWSAARRIEAHQETSQTPFEQARLAACSLKTEHTVKRHPRSSERNE